MKFLGLEAPGNPNVLDVLQEETIDEMIMALIVKDSSIPTERMAEIIGVNVKTIKRHIKKVNGIRYIAVATADIGR